MRMNPSLARGITFLLGIAVLLSAIAAVAAVPQPAGTVGLAQDAPSGTVEAGATIDGEATINATGYNAPAMDVDLPVGWSIAEQDADGNATFKESTNEWVWTEGGEHTVTFTVQVAGDASAGNYTISNNGSAVDPADDSIVIATDASTVTVEEDDSEDTGSGSSGGNTGGSSSSSGTSSSVATATPNTTPSPETATPTVVATAIPTPEPATAAPPVTPTATAEGAVPTPETPPPTETMEMSGGTSTQAQIAAALLIGTVFAGLIGWRLRG